MLRRRIKKFLVGRGVNGNRKANLAIEPPKFELVHIHVKQGSSALRDAALDYLTRGWSVVPIRSWEEHRKPFIKWRRFQTTRPTREQVRDWWTTWPDAGIAVALGPVSDLLCVDVDGENAHRILLDLLGEIPEAPTVKSGGSDPFRYHIYFSHPKLETVASKTPWNRPDDKGKLELRGQSGLVVLPPSLHRSGRRYAWVRGRGIDEVALPELPEQLLDGLEAALKSSVPTAGSEPMSAESMDQANGQEIIAAGYRVAPSTARFLTGQYAEASGWNNRLFRAACDLHARGVPRTKAEPLLLLGVRPRTRDDGRAAADTIAQAYSETRIPSRF